MTCLGSIPCLSNASGVLMIPRGDAPKATVPPFGRPRSYGQAMSAAVLGRLQQRDDVAPRVLESTPPLLLDLGVRTASPSPSQESSPGSVTERVRGRLVHLRQV